MKGLNISGAWVYTPQIWPDQRGSFFELFRDEEFAADLGYQFALAQANCSVSRRGVIRGIHFADVPPGQAKYVCCVSGAVLDVVVDVRTGSPTFGLWEAVELDAASGQAVFLTEGLGHGFMALSDEATVVYLCSAPYNPRREHTIAALDDDLAIAWPAADEAVLSGRDAAAPSLAQAQAAGLLPGYAVCQAWQSTLRDRDEASRRS